jgi:biopolymer transport protein ExbD
MAGTTQGGRPGRTPITGINVTPMVDICLVLLIIMMVSAQYIVSKAISVDLPKAAASDGPAASPTVVTITRDGMFKLNGTELPATGLEARFREVRSTQPGTSLVISADHEASHGKVMQVIDAAKVAGISKFAIQVEQRAP